MAKILSQATVDLSSTVGRSYGWQAKVTDRLLLISSSQNLPSRPGHRIANPPVFTFVASAFTLNSGHFLPADALRLNAAMAFPQTTVYVLKSDSDPTRYYTGLTSNLSARLSAHNAGRVPHTADGKPWIIDVMVEFADERRAIALEKYLKSGSGCAFAKRHLR